MTLRLLLILGLVVLWHGPVQAQQSPSLGPDGAVGAALSLRSGASWAGSRAIHLLGLGGTLRLSPSWEVGGEGVLSLGPAGLSEPAVPEGAEVFLGYGGLLLRLGGEGEGAHAWRGSLLLGAGSVKVRSSADDTEIARENFVVAEPSLQALFRPADRLRLTLEAGYRIIVGRNVLPGLSSGDLRRPVISVGMQVVFDP